MMSKKPLSIYIHIPFCKRKCAYCDFLSFAAGSRIQREYGKALLREIKDYFSKEQKKQVNFIGEYEVRTVFFGGGTPSLLMPEEIGELLYALRESISFSQAPEITIEANPGTLTEEKLKKYKEMGINRLSMGLQSARDEELKILGRIHTYGEFLINYHMARKAGIENLNIDLMSALPGQTLTAWLSTLKKVVMLKPEHISAYSLIIEEGTPFYSTYHNRAALLPTEEEERAIYWETDHFLTQAGYVHYEISNYAKPGYECIHNQVYWSGADYLGFGLGASSYIKGVRYHNEEEMESYLLRAGRKNIKKEEAVLSDKERMEEYMFLGLRRRAGVSIGEFEKRFSRTMEQVYGGTISWLRKEGFLEQKGDRIYLTNKGIDVSNPVLSEFLLEADNPFR